VSASGRNAPAPQFFRSASELRAWLEKNHDSVSELWIGFFNQRSGKTGLTYREALDESLCFGWIDGVRKSVDEGRYMQRFTPRKARSMWSLVNMKRVGEVEGGAARIVRRPGSGTCVREGGVREDVRASRLASRARTRPSPGALARALGGGGGTSPRARKAWAWVFQARPPGYRHLANLVRDERRRRTRRGCAGSTR
jgi:hypothetical protein